LNENGPAWTHPLNVAVSTSPAFVMVIVWSVELPIACTPKSTSVSDAVSVAWRISNQQPPPPVVAASAPLAPGSLRQPPAAKRAARTTKILMAP